MLTLDKIYHASYVLKDVIRQTNIVQARGICDDCDVYLKPENLQITGSFKVRGSGYKISQLTEEEKARGVIACSAGNHAQGVALAATKYGIKSLICLPDGAPISKVEATKNYGAEVCMVPGVYDDAYNEALRLRDEKNYTFIHPFDDENVIAGQGTIGIEIMNEMPDVDAVVCAIGGGGLISGVACAIKSLNPNIKVYGVQAEGAPSMVESIKNGEPVHLDSVSTIADGIQVKEPGEHTFEYVKKYVDDIVTVSDDEISSAILKLIESQKMIAEGAGAAPLAAVMFNKLPVKGKKCEIQLAYAIGVAKPVSIMVDTFGTSKYSNEELANAVEKVFDCRPQSIIRQLKLTETKYLPLAAYGHMGREELGVEWEKTNKVDELLKAVG